MVPAPKWPSACQFLSDGEITALLPQATGITRTPQKVSVLTLDKTQSGAAPEGACTFDLWLKGVTIKDVRSSVEVQIAAIADPKLIEKVEGPVAGLIATKVP